ncbi:hypothetical protein [Mycolicibacterium sp. lyk4-40-TYG-92]|uniref:hypothetical protein n=1 Tax=Mycolicibacterium sp. lyk4-40-TYG-92 TaxID=3040295 RepID=UPI00254B326E|nr:hypothetical protein [Mycolicibacterium sp. lyk4-40-TYG-92]
MRWYARPETSALQLRFAPRLASWNKADDPDQIRLREYLDDTEVLLADSRVEGPWALRLDVGLPSTRNLLDAADLDNFAYPLAYRLRDPGLVSVWCTKRHDGQSLVRIEPATEAASPPTTFLLATPTVSASTTAFKEQICAAVAGEAELPAGPVKLELSFVVRPRRNWLNLWKQTIDALDPLLGRTNPDRAWHPRDGRITELGMHVTFDSTMRNSVAVGIAATQARETCTEPRNTTNETERISSPWTRPAVILGQAGDPLVAQNPTPDAARSAGMQIDRKSLREDKIDGHDAGPYEFRDDDAGYLSWLAAHPYGYVINIARSHSLAAARIHQACCRTINGQNPRNGVWTGPYVKVCADYLADLVQWAIENLRQPIPPCGICHVGAVR